MKYIYVAYLPPLPGRTYSRTSGMWTNGKAIKAAAHRLHQKTGERIDIYRMRYSRGPWDGPTFRHCADHWQTIGA